MPVLSIVKSVTELVNSENGRGTKKICKQFLHKCYSGKFFVKLLVLSSR